MWRSSWPAPSASYSANKNGYLLRYAAGMVIAFAFATFVSTLLGGVFALRNRDRLHLILGFTGGVLLGLVAFDLLPEIFELSHSKLGNVPTPLLVFAGGFLLLHVAERALAMHSAHEAEYGEHRHRKRVGTASAFALAAHSFMDGVGIGLAFQVNEAVGVAVAIAVLSHDFADGLNTVSIMLSHHHTRRRAALLLGLDAIAPVLGAASTMLFTVSDGVLALYLGFFAGFLLYLATSDILPEAHSRHPSRLTLMFTIAGMALMWMVVALS